MKHDGEDYTKVDTRFVVEVPKSWSLAPDLLLNGDTERYRAAMRCVLRYPNDPYPYRDTEWRPWPPKVTVQSKSITVEHRAVTIVDATGDRDFGPWRISVGKRFWTPALLPPPALDKAWWQEITVDLGGRAARTVSPTPTKGSVTRLTWTRTKAGHSPPDVRIQIQPPATKALAAQWNDSPWYLVGSATFLSYDLVLFAVLLLLVRRLRRSPVSWSPTPAEEATHRNLLLWACVMFAAVLAFEVDDQAPRFLGDHGIFPWWPDHRVAVHLVISTLGGGALVLFGRPGRAAGTAAALAVAYIGVVASTLGWSALPPGFWLSTEHGSEIDHFRMTWGFLRFRPRVRLPGPRLDGGPGRVRHAAATGGRRRGRAPGDEHLGLGEPVGTAELAEHRGQRRGLRPLARRGTPQRPGMVPLRLAGLDPLLDLVAEPDGRTRRRALGPCPGARRTARQSRGNRPPGHQHALRDGDRADSRLGRGLPHVAGVGTAHSARPLPPSRPWKITLGTMPRTAPGQARTQTPAQRDPGVRPPLAHRLRAHLPRSARPAAPPRPGPTGRQASRTGGAARPVAPMDTAGRHGAVRRRPAAGLGGLRGTGPGLGTTHHLVAQRVPRHVPLVADRPARHGCRSLGGPDTSPTF